MYITTAFKFDQTYRVGMKGDDGDITSFVEVELQGVELDGDLSLVAISESEGTYDNNSFDITVIESFSLTPKEKDFKLDLQKMLLASNHVLEIYNKRLKRVN